MKRTTLFIFTYIFLFVNILLSQETTGIFTGFVTDTNNNALSGVNISLESESLQGTRGTASDKNGNFKIVNLPVGLYDITITMVGYRNVKIEDARIRLAQTTNLGNITLEEQAIDLPEVIIAGNNMLIDPTSTIYGGYLHADDYENLPIDRDYKSAVSLLPQANTSYYGDEVNVAGATGFENKYFVDGVEVTDPLIGASGTNLPYNFIKEIQLKAGGYQPGAQSALGGIINVVTYSGSNEFHGSAFGFYTSNVLSTKKELGYFDPEQGSFSDYDIGFGLGGPIIKDNLWFFVAYNPTYKLRDAEVISHGTFVDKTITHSLAAKVNWRVSNNLSFVLTATGDPTQQDAVNRDAFPVNSATNPDPYFHDLVEGGLNLALKGTYTAGNNFILEGSAAIINRHDSAVPATERGRNEVIVYDVSQGTLIASGGPMSQWDSERFSKIFSLSGIYYIADHTIRAGLAYKENSVDNNYKFHYILKWADNYFEEEFVRGIGEVHNRIPSLFIQDSWQISRNLNIYGGIRWETQSIVGTNGEVVQNVTTPIQPRLGFAYIFDKQGAHKIYGSAGRFSQEFGLFKSVDYHSDEGYEFKVVHFQDPRIDNSQGDTVNFYQHVIVPEVPGLRGQYFDEFSLGYEQLIGENFRVGLQGLYRTLREAIDDAYFPDAERYQFGNPGSGIMEAWPEAQRDYRALIFTIEQRGSRDFNFLASYTLSRDYGNYEGLFDAFSHGQFPNNNLSFNDLENSRKNATGLVPQDRTHTFKFSGYYNFPFGLVTGLTFVAQSGTPLSEYASALSRNGIKFSVPRGSAGRTEAIWDLNLRLLYELPFINFSSTNLILDVFHIAGQQKAVDLVQEKYLLDDEDNYVPNPTFGRAYRYQPPMSVRFGIEVRF